MEDKCVFIIDEEIINRFSLLESNGSEYYEGENAQRFLEYLSYRKHNKKAFMIPSIYKKLIKAFTINDGESLGYFKNLVREGDIGESPDTTEEQDTISLFETLEVLYEKVFVISDKYDGNANFKNIPVLTMDKLDNYLRDKKDFMKYIQDMFYGDSY